MAESEPKPLENRTLPFTASNDNGIATREVPALSKGWCAARDWMPFSPPPLTPEAGDLDLWCERTRFVLADLDFLLSLEHHKFWSQLVFDESVHKSLERLLQFLPRNFDLDFDILAAQDRISSLLQVRLIVLA